MANNVLVIPPVVYPYSPSGVLELPPGGTDPYLPIGFVPPSMQQPNPTTAAGRSLVGFAAAAIPALEGIFGSLISLLLAAGMRGGAKPVRPPTHLVDGPQPVRGLP